MAPASQFQYQQTNTRYGYRKNAPRLVHFSLRSWPCNMRSHAVLLISGLLPSGKAAEPALRRAAVGGDRLDGEVARRLAGGNSCDHPLGFEATAGPRSARAGMAVFGRHLLASGLPGALVRSRVGARDVHGCEPMLRHERPRFRNRPRTLSGADLRFVESRRLVDRAAPAASSYSPSRVFVHLNGRDCRRVPEVRLPSQAAAPPQLRDHDGVLLKVSHPARGQVVGQVENADTSLGLPRAFARAADCWRRAQSCAFDKRAQFFVPPVLFILRERLAERASCADDHCGFAALRAQPVVESGDHLVDTQRDGTQREHHEVGRRVGSNQ